MEAYFVGSVSSGIGILSVNESGSRCWSKKICIARGAQLQVYTLLAREGKQLMTSSVEFEIKSAYAMRGEKKYPSRFALRPLGQRSGHRAESGRSEIGFGSAQGAER